MLNPLIEPSPSDSTAHRDDTLFLRALVKDVNHDNALDYLIKSKYADKESWDRA